MESGDIDLALIVQLRFQQSTQVGCAGLRITLELAHSVLLVRAVFSFD
jgi:hypothetical protein